MKVEDYEAKSESSNSDSSPAARLEALKQLKFPPAEKAARVARAIAVLNEARLAQSKAPRQLSPEEWKQIAEDPELEDQF